MKDSKLVNMFDTIPKIKLVSKYSKDLNKLFPNNTLNSLCFTLKHPRRFEKKLFLEIFNAKYPKYPSQYSDERLLANATQKDKGNSNTFSNREIRKKIKAISQSNINKKKYLNSLKETPDPFRYNPNYDSIYRKSYAATMKTSDREKEHDKSQIPIINNNNNIKPVLPLNQQYERDRIFNHTNHALKFSQYTFRKGIINEKDYNSERNEVVVVNWKEKSEIKAPDFAKMIVREDNCFINKNSLGVPTSSYYHPNFSLINERSPQVKFSKEKPVLSKKYLIKKLWSNFQVDSDYKLVDFNANKA